MLDAEKTGQPLLEPFSEAAGGEPEVKGGIDQMGDLPVVEDPAGICDPVAGDKGLLLLAMADRVPTSVGDVAVLNKPRSVLISYQLFNPDSNPPLATRV